MRLRPFGWKDGFLVVFFGALGIYMAHSVYRAAVTHVIYARGGEFIFERTPGAFVFTLVLHVAVVLMSAFFC